MSIMVSRHTGFTLLELMVGITIAGFLLLALREAAVSFANTTTATVDAARSQDRKMIAWRRLERLVDDMQPDSNGMGTLEGNDKRAEFDSWCVTPEGWQEPCRVLLEISSDRSQHARLEIRSSEARSILSIFQGDSLAMVYLADASNGGSWRASWTRTSSLPLAIGVVDGTDTLVVPVGAR